MKLHTLKRKVLNAEDKFSLNRFEKPAPVNVSQSELSQLDLTQLGELVIGQLNDKNLEVSKVRPFFWTLVETYVDRFDFYPFDVDKLMFSHLEACEYPEEAVRLLVKQLESRFEKTHGRPLRKSTHLVCQQDALDDEIKRLRGSLKYAAMVAEMEE